MISVIKSVPSIRQMVFKAFGFLGFPAGNLSQKVDKITHEGKLFCVIHRKTMCFVVAEVFEVKEKE